VNQKVDEDKDEIIRAPAKINLVLKVTGRRPDGYHEIFSIMVPVDLCDTIHIMGSRKGISLQCRGKSVPADRRNLAWKACEAFFSEAGIEPAVHIVLEKVIPVAAGLGGGSSDAAAVLRALNRRHGNPLGQERLHEIARALGADVPFFLYGVPSVAKGIGDILEPMENWPQFWYVIITPPFGISTAWVYAQVKLELTQPTDNYIVNVHGIGPKAIIRLLENDLERVVLSRYPQLVGLKQLMLALGADGAVMSGSGPSRVGVFTEKNKASYAAELIASKKAGQVFLATLWRNEIV